MRSRPVMAPRNESNRNGQESYAQGLGERLMFPDPCRFPGGGAHGHWRAVFEVSVAGTTLLVPDRALAWRHLKSGEAGRQVFWWKDGRPGAQLRGWLRDPAAGGVRGPRVEHCLWRVQVRCSAQATCGGGLPAVAGPFNLPSGCGSWKGRSVERARRRQACVGASEVGMLVWPGKAQFSTSQIAWGFCRLARPLVSGAERCIGDEKSSW